MSARNLFSDFMSEPLHLKPHFFDAIKLVPAVVIECWATKHSTLMFDLEKIALHVSFALGHAVFRRAYFFHERNAMRLPFP